MEITVPIIDMSDAVLARCSNPGCDHSSHDSTMYMHPNCHMGMGLRVIAGDGVVRLWCEVCDRPVCVFAVDSSSLSGELRLRGTEIQVAFDREYVYIQTWTGANTPPITMWKLPLVMNNTGEDSWTLQTPSGL